MDSPIIYSEDCARIDSLPSAKDFLALRSVAPTVALDNKEDLDAVLGLYMCDNTTFTSFASLVSLTAVVAAQICVTGDSSAHASAHTEAESDFDFFGFGSNFQSRARSEPQVAEHSAMSDAVIEKYPLLADPLTAALELGADASLVLDAALSGSADPIFSADDDTDDCGAVGLTGPTLSADTTGFVLPTATMPDLSCSPPSAYSRSTAPYTPYTTPRLDSPEIDPPPRSTSLCVSKTLRVRDGLVQSEKVVPVDITHQTQLEATVAFEKWRHACLALAAFQSTIVIREEESTRPLYTLPDTAVDTCTSMLPTTQIEPVSKPGALRGNKHKKLFAAISAISAASTTSVLCRSIQIQAPKQEAGTEIGESFTSALSVSSLDQYSTTDPRDDFGCGYDGMPSFAATMSVFVSCTHTFASVDAFASTPSSPLLRGSPSSEGHSAPICGIESIENLPCSMSAEAEPADLAVLSTVVSARREGLQVIPSRISMHSSSPRTREEAKRSCQPLMLSFPSIQLTKRRLGTIQEVFPSDGVSSSFSHALLTSHSGVLSVSSSESGVLVTNPPSTSPYSHHSFVFESMTFDHFIGTCLRPAASANPSASVSMESGDKTTWEGCALPPLPPLAVAGFPCSSPRLSRSSSAFHQISISLSRLASRRPMLSEVKTIPSRFSAAPPPSKVCNVKIENPSHPGRLTFKKLFHKIKGFF